MPKNKSIKHEFSKFWKKLDYNQQFSLLSLAIISISIILGLSAIQSQQLLQSQAFKPSIEVVTQETAELPIPYELSSERSRSSCVVAGCSGELCVDASQGDINSICLWKEEYACYQKLGVCELQTHGRCGWTPTPELTQCLTAQSDLELPISAEIQPITRRQDSTNCPTVMCPQGSIMDDNCNCIAIDIKTDRYELRSDQATSKVQTCQNTGGNWRTFSDGCADFCGVNPEDACTMAMTDSCDCGPGSCWNGQACTPKSREEAGRSLPQYARTVVQPIITEPRNPHIQTCLASGGTWEEFPNTCTDSCDLVTDALVACGDAITDGCNCGPTSCWNGSACIPNPATKVDRSDPLSKFGFNSLSLQDIIQNLRDFFRFYR